MRIGAAAAGRAGVPFIHRTWVKLVLGSMGLVILSILLTAGLIVRLATAELRGNVLKWNQQIARRTADQIGSFVDEARRELIQTADMIHLVERVPWVSDVLLENEVLASGFFETVVVLGRDGTVRGDNEVTPADLSGFSGEALAKAAAGMSWMSPVTFDANGLPGMAFVLPAGQEEAILARLSLQRIWRIIDDIDAGPGGAAFVVSGDGTLVASPDKAAVLRGDKPPVSSGPARKGSLLVSSPVPLLGWTVFIEQPLSLAFLPVDLVLRRSLYLVLAAVALSFLIGVVVARLYVRSLDALLRGTTRIAEGDLEYRIPASGRDEVGVLSRAFNDMVRRLEERSSALHASEERYRTVTNGVSDIIYSMDREGRFTFLNQRVRGILGMQPEEMLGRRMTDFVIPWQRRKKMEDLRRTFADGSPVSDIGEARAVTRDGREVILEYESSPTVGPTGDQLIYGIARDVTLRRALEEKLRRSEKLAALGEIVSRVAHELRNAVAGIAASMTLARERGLPGEEQGQELDRAFAEARRAQDIVEGLLGAPPRLPTGRSSVTAALRDVLAMRRRALDEAGIIVTVDLAPDLPEVMGDSSSLRQVFHNIVDNAQRALATLGVPGGKRLIMVTTVIRDGSICVEISDTGPGIAAEHIGRIFDPFYTTRGKEGGTGLGLAVSLGIIEAFGGDMTVRSTPGQGTAFSVVLPSAGPVVDRAAPASLAGCRVLVVEDEPALRDFIHHYVASLGCETASAANGREAEAFLASAAACDLVISDVRMPDRDGKDLYEWIRGSRPALLSRLIYVTGDSMNPETRAFLAEAGVPYLLKPVVASLLEEQVRRLLGSTDGAH
jgi:two-component system NtrC family sensor kinase